MTFRWTSMVAGLACVFGALAIQAPPVQAEPVRYEAAYVFGDSLSDPGNFFALTGEPGFPYVEGRFSNGPVWAEYLAADFARAGLTFRNYAHGFGRVISPEVANSEEPSSFLPINLDDQLARFLADAAEGVPARSAALVFMGSNDSFRIISDTLVSIIGGADPAVAAAQAIADAQEVAGRLASSLSVLAPAGIRDLVLFNLPNLGQTPFFVGTEVAPLASLVAQAYNFALASVSVAGVNLRPFAVDELFAGLALAPEDFGVTSLQACFNQFDFAGLCTDPNDRAFYDLLHPSAPIHARLAEEVRMIVAPIPLPAAGWLLLVGLAGLGAVGIGRRG